MPSTVSYLVVAVAAALVITDAKRSPEVIATVNGAVLGGGSVVEAKCEGHVRGVEGGAGTHCGSQVIQFSKADLPKLAYEDGWGEWALTAGMNSIILVAFVAITILLFSIWSCCTCCGKCHPIKMNPSTKKKVGGGALVVTALVAFILCISLLSNNDNTHSAILGVGTVFNEFAELTDNVVTNITTMVDQVGKVSTAVSSMTAVAGTCVGDVGDILKELTELNTTFADIDSSLVDLKGGFDDMNSDVKSANDDFQGEIENAADQVHNGNKTAIIIILLIIGVNVGIFCCNTFCAEGKRPRDKSFFNCIAITLSLIYMLFLILVTILVAVTLFMSHGLADFCVQPDTFFQVTLETKETDFYFKCDTYDTAIETSANPNQGTLDGISKDISSATSLTGELKALIDQLPAISGCSDALTTAYTSVDTETKGVSTVFDENISPLSACATIGPIYFNTIKQFCTDVHDVVAGGTKLGICLVAFMIVLEWTKRMLRPDMRPEEEGQVDEMEMNDDYNRKYSDDSLRGRNSITK